MSDPETSGAEELYAFGRSEAERIVASVRDYEGRTPDQRNYSHGVEEMIYAKITSDEGSGNYGASQVVRSSGSWAVLADGRVWDNEATDLPWLQEITGAAGIANDTIVVVFVAYEAGDSPDWFFVNGGDGDEKVKVTSNDTTADYLYNQVNIDPDSTLANIVTDGDSPLVYAEKDNGGDEALFLGFDIANLSQPGLNATDLFVVSQGIARKSVATTLTDLSAYIENDIISGTSADIDEDYVNDVDISVKNVITFEKKHLDIDPTNGLLQTNQAIDAEDVALTVGGKWIELNNEALYHKESPVSSESDDDHWIKVRFYKESAGANWTIEVDDVSEDDVALLMDETNHVWGIDLGESNPETPTGPNQLYKYKRCGTEDTFIYRESDEGTVIDINDTHCYELVGLVTTTETANTDTVIDDYADCPACVAGQVNYQWVLCSDGVTVCAIFSEGNQPDDSYAWVYYSGAYVKAKYDQMTADTATDPCWVGTDFVVPTQCDDVGENYFSDPFSDNSLDTCRWTDNSSGGSIAETNQRMECTAPSGANYGRASNRVTETAYSGNFRITDTITPITFSAPSSGTINGEIFVGTTGGDSFSVRIVRSSSYYKVRYYDGATYQNAKDYSTPPEVAIVRNGSTVYTYIDGTLYDTRGSVSGTIQYVNLNGSTEGGSDVGCVVAHDDFAISTTPGAADNVQVKLCSDDSDSFVISAAVAAALTYDYFFGCVGGVWTKVYVDDEYTFAVATDPSILEYYTDPTNCAGLDAGWPVSDSFSGSGADSGAIADDNWIGRYDTTISDGASISGGALHIDLGIGDDNEGLRSWSVVIPDGATWESDFANLALTTSTTRTRGWTHRIDDAAGHFVQLYIERAAGSNTQRLKVNSDTEGVNDIEANSSTSGTLKIERSGNDFLMYLDGVLKDTVTNANLATSCGTGARAIAWMLSSGAATGASTVDVTETRLQTSGAVDITVDPAGNSCT